MGFRFQNVKGQGFTPFSAFSITSIIIGEDNYLNFEPNPLIVGMNILEEKWIPLY